MINLFRNLLLNITAKQQEEASIKEEIPKQFFPLTFPSAIESIRKLLVGKGSLDTQALRVLNLLRLVFSNELEVYLFNSKNIFTFVVKTDKFFNEDFVFNIVSIEQQIAKSNSLTSFFSETAKLIAKDIHKGLIKIYQNSEDSVYRLSVIVVLFLLAAEAFLDNHGK